MSASDLYLDSPPRSWICDSCIEHGTHLSLRVMRRYFVPLPTDASATCATCGDPLPDLLRVRLLLEEIAVREAPCATPTPRAVRPPSILSLNAAARRLGRSKATIRRLQIDGVIRSVPWPGKRAKDAFPLAEIERFEREGVPPAMPTPRPERKPKRTTAAVRGERAAAVARILAVEEPE